MVNPGAFRGSRREFLVGEKANYAAAVNGGFQKDAVALIQRRYLKRYPISLAHDVEPSQEHLDAVDDDAPDPEPEQPDAEKLSSEEYDAAMKVIKERGELLSFRKGVSFGLFVIQASVQ